MQNYLRPLYIMQWKLKKKNFNKIGSREKPLENFTFDLDVPIRTSSLVYMLPILFQLIFGHRSLFK